jgi:hypothetical protein
MMKILLPVQSGGIGYEGVWVEELSSNIGKIDNLPVFSQQYKYGDTIKFDPVTCKAICVIREGGYTPTEIVQYKGKFEDEKAKWESAGYIIEGWQPGVMAIAKKRERR